LLDDIAPVISNAQRHDFSTIAAKFDDCVHCAIKKPIEVAGLSFERGPGSMSKTFWLRRDNSSWADAVTTRIFITLGMFSA